MRHPDYDIEFKPQIAIYDWDQTYDVMQIPHLDLSGGRFIDNIPVSKVCLFDRYTPDNIPWAEDYSTKLFNTLKRYNYIGEIRIQRSSGDVDLNEPISLPKNEYFCTLLIGQVNNKSNSKIEEWNKYRFEEYLEINKHFFKWDGSEIILNDYLKSRLADNRVFIRNSMVVSTLNRETNEFEIVDFDNPQLSYSQLGNSLSTLEEILDAGLPPVEPDKPPLRHFLSEFTLVSTTRKRTITYNVVSVFGKITTEYKVDWYLASSKITSRKFEKLDPFYENYCFLAYANNEFWMTGNRSSRGDLGYVYPVKKDGSIFLKVLDGIIAAGANVGNGFSSIGNLEVLEVTNPIPADRVVTDPFGSLRTYTMGFYHKKTGTSGAIIPRDAQIYKIAKTNSNGSFQGLDSRPGFFGGFINFSNIYSYTFSSIADNFGVLEEDFKYTLEVKQTDYYSSRNIEYVPPDSVSTVEYVGYTSGELATYDNALAEEIDNIIKDIKDKTLPDSEDVNKAYSTIGAKEFAYLDDGETPREYSVYKYTKEFVKSLGIKENEEGNLIIPTIINFL